MFSGVRRFKLFGLVMLLVMLGSGGNLGLWPVDQAEASTLALRATRDIILRLSGLETTIYVAEGGEVNRFTFSGPEFNAYGLQSAVVFLLKTDGHKVLQTTPVGGSADLSLSSSHITNGYLGQWTATSSVQNDYLVGVPEVNRNYAVKVDGVLLGVYNSGAGAEIAFSRTGSGVPEVFIIEGVPPVVSTESARNISTGSAELRCTVSELNAEAAEFRFEWGRTSETLDNTTAWEDISAVGEYGQFLTDLIFDRVYYYRAVARNVYGISYGNILSFQTLAGDYDIILELGPYHRTIRVGPKGTIEVERVEK